MCVFVGTRMCVRMHERKTEKQRETLKEQRKEKEAVRNHSIGVSVSFPFPRCLCFLQR